MTAWLAIAAGDDREHGGNAGYNDVIAAHYFWDTTVPHHADLKVGDVLVLWDKEILLGASVIGAISTKPYVKTLFKCPECGKAKIKARKTLHNYKCYDCKSVFGTPDTKTMPVTSFRSDHEAGWTDLTGELSGAQLRKLTFQPGSQHSLRALIWPDFLAELSSTAHAAIQMTLAPALEVAEGHKISSVRIRVGQGAFRAKMLSEYGPVCAVTGPTPKDALDAAHLYSYAVEAKHHPHGGLLLRRDIHRLFDMGLIAVNPDSLTIDVGATLHPYPSYLALQGCPLAVSLGEAEKGWIQLHWDQHRPQPAHVT